MRFRTSCFLLLAALGGGADFSFQEAVAREPVVDTYAQWQPVELDFIGPQASETGKDNPFMDKRLLVTFTGPEGDITVRGFFAADGNAANSSAEEGDVWRARLMPETPGQWSYKAELRSGAGIALEENLTAGEAVPLSDAQGSFHVRPAREDDLGFYARGILRQSGHMLAYPDGSTWLKGGANSPENLFGFVGFDGTYRQSASARDGEAAVDGELHSYAPHLGDWREGDPVWRGDRGKALIGAVNYLADQKMNVIYLLTMNVGGDGKDVWPWREPDDPRRFDVSKLAQWNIVFEHMQRRGITIHLVMQETENELLLDGGDTGPDRQLYFQELIARFSHHPGLLWNLGEENGPVNWMPEGQSDAQRVAMARYVSANDPYGHPVLLHSHSEPHDKDEILTPLLGESALSGLSFQVSDRQFVNVEMRKWREMSDEAGRSWLIGMDEIGLWQVGARADRDDPHHDSLRRHAMWGAFLGGAYGVEWYFGAEQDGNDLTTEDWRSREELWRQTAVALEYLQSNADVARMEPCNGEVYCLEEAGRNYVFYLSPATPIPGRESFADGEYLARFFDPVSAEFDSIGYRVTIEPGQRLPALLTSPQERDAVVSLTRLD